MSSQSPPNPLPIGSNFLSSNPLYKDLSQNHLNTLALIVTKSIALGLDVVALPQVTEGSRVTLFRLRLQGKTRIGNLESIASELELILKRPGILIQAIPTEGCVGVFIPRSENEILQWYTLLSNPAVAEKAKQCLIPLVLGTDWLGTPYVDDLTKLPHLLVAGSTNSGKSVFMRSIIASIVQKMNSKIRLVLSDTKGVEFNEFVGSPHLLYGERAVSPLRTVEHMDNLCKEVDQRLETFGHAGVRNIQDYNDRLERDGRGAMQLPYIVLAIDELADIVDLANEKGRARKIGAEKLDYLTRKARAAGIHVIAGVQRPSVDVVKGVVKANFVARIAFRTATAIDSRVILDEDGAEHLMERGDMLYNSPNMPGLMRLHSAYASSEAIRAYLEYSIFEGERKCLP